MRVLKGPSRILLGSFSQSIICQVESLFTFLASPLATSHLNPALSLFSAFLSNRFITLTLLSGPATSKKHCPPYAAQTLNKRRVRVSEMLSKLGGGKTTHYRVRSYSCKPNLHSTQVCHFQSTCYTAGF